MPKRSIRLAELLLPAALLGLALLALSPILHNGFVWDDEAFFIRNNAIRGFDWPRVRWMFTTFYMGQYRPLSWIVCALNYRLWGLNPFGYHLTNLVLHGANTLLFYFLGKSLLEQSLGKARAGEIRMSAAFSAALFGLHPLRVDSVALASNCHALLATLFALLTVLFYIRGRLKLSLLFYAPSLLCKASAAVMPVVLLILDYYPSGERRILLRNKIPYFALAIPTALVAIKAQLAVGNLTPLEQHGLIPRLAQSVFGIGFYLAKSLVPANLSPLYPLQQPEIPQVIESIFVIMAVLAVLKTLRASHGALVAAWGCYVVLLLPVLGLFQNGSQLVALRYSYESCLGWALFAGAGMVLLLREAKAVARLAVLFAAVAVLAALGRATWVQASYWRDGLTLWSRAVAVAPDNADAHVNLGAALFENGRYQEAVEHYEQALVLKPKFPAAWLNLANAYLRLGRLDDAVSYCSLALAARPNWVEAHNLIADALARQGRWDLSVAHFREVTRIRPRSAQAYQNLGVGLARQGRLQEAIGEFEHALQIDPKNPVYAQNLAVAREELAKGHPR